jgi:hypothetical protein
MYRLDVYAGMEPKKEMVTWRMDASGIHNAANVRVICPTERRLVFPKTNFGLSYSYIR